MTPVFVALGLLGLAFAGLVAVILWSSVTLLSTAGAVEADEMTPQYVLDARAALASVEAQFEVAQDLHQDPQTIEDLRVRVLSAQKTLENAKRTAAEQAGLVPTGQQTGEGITPVPVRIRRSATDK